MSIDSSFFGIEFLPIERKVYLKIQSILRRLEVRLPSLKQTFFLYRDQIIWYIQRILSIIIHLKLVRFFFAGVVLVKMIRLYSIHFFDGIIGQILKHYVIHLQSGTKKDHRIAIFELICS